jgi:acetyltransferase
VEFDVTVESRPERAQRLVEALLAPRNIAIVGANDRPGSWPARTYQNLKQYGFPGAVYPVNPKRPEIWDGPCYPDLRSLPEPPDHLAVLVPATAVAAVLREGAAAGARSATVFTSGIGDASGNAGAHLAHELREVIAQTGLAVSGPNCMGNFCARTRMATFNDPAELPPGPGPVAMVGQSGGVMLFISRALRERGIEVGTIVTSGNEMGLTSADFIAAFAADPAVRVIVSYIEGVRDPGPFRDACTAARAAGKTIVFLRTGRSPGGRLAATDHSGAVAGSLAVLDELDGEPGIVVAPSADDVVDVVECVLHVRELRGRRLAGLTLSGAFRGLLLDAAADAGLSFPPLAARTVARLNEVLGAGALVSNPVDGGFGIVTSPETYRACIEALDADENVDMIVIQEELSRDENLTRSERWMEIAESVAATSGTKPIAYASFVSYGLTSRSRELRARLPHLAILQECNRALRAIAAVAPRA